MKKIVSILLALIMGCAVFCSCGANPKCEYDAALEAMSENDEITVYIAEDEKEYKLELAL